MEASYVSLNVVVTLHCKGWRFHFVIVKKTCNRTKIINELWLCSRSRVLQSSSFVEKLLKYTVVSQTTNIVVFTKNTSLHS